MDTATHLRLLLPLLLDAAAAACWARVFVLTRSGPLLRDSRLAPPHPRKIGVLHGERRRGARRHMPHLVSAPQPARRGFNVKRARRAQRHRQFGTPCVLALWAKRVRNQRLQMGGKGGNWDQGGGVWLHLGGLFARCPIFTLLGRLSNWAPCGSLLGGAWSELFPIIVQREPQLLLKGPEPPILCCLSCCWTWPSSVSRL